MKRRHSRWVFALLVASLCAGAYAFSAEAQNTSSVPSPQVNAGAQEVEYRLGWIPSEDRYRHRFDYGAALNARQAFKVFANIEDQPGEDPRFDDINVEYLIELTPETARGWQSGIRFDGRIASGPDPDRAGLVWTNRWHIGERTQARAAAIATREFGDRATDSIAIELRASLIYDLGAGYNATLLSFSDLGTSDEFGPDGESQQLGPTLSGPIANGWSWTAGNLFGLSDAAPDNDVRFWIARDF